MRMQENQTCKVIIDVTQSPHDDWEDLKTMGSDLQDLSSPIISDDNAVSSFCLYCSRNRQSEDHLWRTLSVNAPFVQ